MAWRLTWIQRVGVAGLINFASNFFFCVAIIAFPFVICWWRGVTAAASTGLKDQLW
jgi:hypothetical protein